VRFAAVVVVVIVVEKKKCYRSGGGGVEVVNTGKKMLVSLIFGVLQPNLRWSE
jgi:hypothetical protein